MDDQGIKIEIISQTQIFEEEENIDDFPDEDQHICLLCDAASDEIGTAGKSS